METLKKNIDRLSSLEKSAKRANERSKLLLAAGKCKKALVEAKPPMDDTFLAQYPDDFRESMYDYWLYTGRDFEDVAETYPATDDAEEALYQMSGLWFGGECEGYADCWIGHSVERYTPILLKFPKGRYVGTALKEISDAFQSLAELPELKIRDEEEDFVSPHYRRTAIKELLDEYLRAVGPTVHPNTFATIEFIARLYFRMGFYDEARTTCDLAIARSKSPGCDSIKKTIDGISFLIRVRVIDDESIRIDYDPKTFNAESLDPSVFFSRATFLVGPISGPPHNTFCKGMFLPDQCRYKGLQPETTYVVRMQFQHPNERAPRQSDEWLVRTAPSYVEAAGACASAEGMHLVGHLETGRSILLDLGQLAPSAKRRKSIRLLGVGPRALREGSEPEEAQDWVFVDRANGRCSFLNPRLSDQAIDRFRNLVLPDGGKGGLWGDADEDELKISISQDFKRILIGGEYGVLGITNSQLSTWHILSKPYGAGWPAAFSGDGSSVWLTARNGVVRMNSEGEVICGATAIDLTPSETWTWPDALVACPGERGGAWLLQKDSDRGKLHYYDYDCRQVKEYGADFGYGLGPRLCLEEGSLVFFSGKIPSLIYRVNPSNDQIATKELALKVRPYWTTPLAIIPGAPGNFFLLSGGQVENLAPNLDVRLIYAVQEPRKNR